MKPWNESEHPRDFYEKGEAYSRASDYLYDYEMWRTDETVEMSPKEAEYEFEKLMYSEPIMEMLYNSKVNPDVDWHDEICKALAQKYKFGYRRMGKNGET